MTTYQCYDKGECISNLNLLMSRKSQIREVINAREDAWSVVCVAFNIDSEMREKIENNSEEPYIRLEDVIHWLFQTVVN